MENLYKILHCSETASLHELKKAYQALALKHHPDKATSSASNQETFIRVNRAWTILRDPWLRNQYDAKWKERCLAQSYPIQDTIHFDDFEEECDESKDETFASDNSDKAKKGDNYGKSCAIKGDNCDMTGGYRTEHYQEACTENISKGENNLFDSGNDDIVSQDIPELSPLNDTNIIYTYECRCGGNYILTGVDVKLKFDIVCCDTCSLSIQVIYDNDDDDDS